jgi:hypothetical protein
MATVSPPDPTPNPPDPLKVDSVPLPRRSGRSVLFLIVLGIFALILIVLGYLYRSQLIDKFSNTSLAVSEGAIVSVIWAMGVGLVLLLIAISWGDVGLSRVLVLSGISGATLGWALGMYFSPEGSPESQAFAGIKTAAVGVLSGYVLSKVQRIFDKYIDENPRLAIIATSNAAPRVSDRLNARIVAPPGQTGEVKPQSQDHSAGAQQQIGQKPPTPKKP